MRYWIALSLCLPLLGMEISLQTGKEEGQNYTVLHLRHPVPFECKATQDEFHEEKRIECIIPSLKASKIPPLNDERLKVSGSSTPSGYRITITPKSKMKLIPVAFDLSKVPQTYVYDIKNAKHWSIIGYIQELPLISQSKPSGPAINFPIKIESDGYPYVGGLDLKGNPIKISRAQDVSDYIHMKEAYASRDYNKVLELSEYVLKHYPNSVFRNELLLYQIRALHEKQDYDRLVETTKSFLRDFSSDPNVPEVLAYTANAYTKIGQSTDADYFYDRLFSEYLDSPYAAVGMFFKARQLEAAGTPKKAKFYYGKALELSKDVDVASKAAFKLAQIELNAGNAEDARGYAEKILKVNPKYFKEVYNDAMNMADNFVYRKDPKTGIRITEALLNATGSSTPQHETLLRNLGLRLAQSGRSAEALKRFNEYLDTYKYGDYIEEVRHAKDGLFFREKETNTSDELKQYDDLIARYGNDNVGRKALYKKAQLLLKEKKYKEVLDLDNELYRLDTQEFPQAASIISQGAIGLEKQYLKEGKCSEAMGVQKMYKVKLLSEWDALLFDCSIKTTQYENAKKIAQSHLKSKVIGERQQWLSRMVKTQFALGDYKQALKGGEELITLLEAEKNPPLNDIYRTVFDTAQRLGDGERMVRHIKSIEAVFGSDFKDVERYTQMVSLGLKQKNEAMIQTYARKVMAMQDRTRTYTQSPYIEFTLSQSLQNVGKDGDALVVLRTLDRRKLSAERRSRQQYLIGAIAQKLGRATEARTALNASIKADPNSAWGKLAKDALGLL